MKNFLLLGFAGIIFMSPGVLAREALLPSSSVNVEVGEIGVNTLLASSGGEMFIEFSNDTHFVHEEGGISFSGEIMPPAVIDLGVDKPKLRMEEIVTFELVSNTGEHVIFADRFDTMYQRNKARERVLNPGSLSRSSWVKLIVPIEDPAVGHPELWEFVGEEEGWSYIGGILGDETPEGVRVFTVVLRRTGAYSLFDAAPPPRHYADEFDGSKDVLSEEEAALWNESGIDLPEGVTWEDIQNGAEGFYLEGIDSEIPSIQKEQGIAVHNRAITTADKLELETMKVKLLDRLTREEDPKKVIAIKELLSLIERKILIADQREQLVERETQLEAAIPAAATARLASDLTDQLAAVKAQLANLNDPSMDQRMIELDGEINGVSGDGVETEKRTPVLEIPVFESSGDAPAMDIPSDAELPKSGADGQDKPSLAFPLALLGFVILIVGSMALAMKRKHS